MQGEERVAGQTAINERIAEIDEVLAECARHMTELDGARADCDDHMKELVGVRRQLMLRRADAIGDAAVDTDRARIKRLVPAATGISWSQIVGDQRSHEVVTARHLAMHMLDKRGYTCSEIGRILDKDHSTVLRSLDAHFYRQPHAKLDEIERACWQQFNRERG
jgi:chromosomal replication initiation ATPase DnaA